MYFGACGQAGSGGSQKELSHVHARLEGTEEVAEELPGNGDRDGIDGPVLAGFVEYSRRSFREDDSGESADIKGLNGHKTDPKDARWIADLLESGKLKGSFVPQPDIRELPDLTRQRVHLLDDLNRVKNRIEQLCQSNNIKISSVATDLLGLSGRTMLQAIVEAKRDPGWMADYARGALRGKKRDLERALEGSFTEHQRWLLDKELRQVDWLEMQIQVLEQEIERRVKPFEEAIGRLLTIPGIERKTAWMLVAELGVDMSPFQDARHLELGGIVPGQARERRTADEWANPQGQLLREAGNVPSGLGRVAYKENVPIQLLPPHTSSQGAAESQHRVGPSSDRGV